MLCETFFFFFKGLALSWLWCLCRAQGQRDAGSSICRQNSPPSGAGCFTNLPHTLPRSIRAHTQTHRCSSHPQINSRYTDAYADARMRSVTNPQACKSIARAHTHTYAHAYLHTHWPAVPCICLVVFLFFPAVVSLAGLEESAAPGEGRARWLTAGSLEVEEPLKQRCFFLSHPDRQHSQPQQPARFHLQTPQGKISTWLSECTWVRLSIKMLNCKSWFLFYSEETIRNTLEISVFKVFGLCADCIVVF